MEPGSRYAWGEVFLSPYKDVLVDAVSFLCAPPPSARSPYVLGVQINSGNVNMVWEQDSRIHNQAKVRERGRIPERNNGKISGYQKQNSHQNFYSKEHFYFIYFF